MQVFTDSDEDGAKRTETLNLFNRPGGAESTEIGRRIGHGQLHALSREQSKFIHDSVLKYRAQLAAGRGREWVEQVKAALRAANPIPSESTRGAGGLTRLCVGIDLPPEPDLDAPYPEAVEVTAPKDLACVTHGVTPAQQPDLPVTLEEPNPLPW